MGDHFYGDDAEANQEKQRETEKKIVVIAIARW